MVKSRIILAACSLLALGLVCGIAFCQDATMDTKTLVGHAAPDFKLPTLDGQEVTLSALKGNVVLLDFWATWCPPCRASLPHIQKISADQELAKKGLKVFAVNSREKKDVIAKFMETNKYTFTVPMAEKDTMAAYVIKGIPTTVVVGRDGAIKNVFIGFGGEKSAQAIDEAVEAALKESK